tara:strand:- start:396 stop:1220 length:825 start_codon:yes stop_codon:yes gene_type:complete
MGRRGGFWGSFATGLTGSLAEGTKDLGRLLIDSRRYTDAQERAKQREAVRVAERKEMMGVQAATQDAAQKDRRLNMMLRTLDPSVMGKGWLLSQQGDDALTAGMPGLIDEGRRLAKEAESRAFWQRKELAKMRRGGGTDPNAKAFYETHKGQLRFMSRQPTEIQKQIDAHAKNMTDPDGTETKALLRRYAHAQDSYAVNGRVKSQLLNKQMPSLADMENGIYLYLRARGQDPTDDELFNSTARYLDYARFRPELLEKQKQDNQPAFNYHWREPK